MTEPREVIPNIPPDWRDWVNEVPTIKTIAVLCIVAWAITPIGMIIASWLIGAGRVTGQPAIDGVIRMVGMWLDALNWLTAAAVFGVVGKFATTKPEVVRAEGEAKAAVVAAAQTGTSPPPASDSDKDKP